MQCSRYPALFCAAEQHLGKIKPSEYKNAMFIGNTYEKQFEHKYVI